MTNISVSIKKMLIGLEIHITLNSKKKIFNWENVYQGDISPNTQVGPWELGYLGVLPILNPEVIELSLKLAAALEMKISRNILFDRKIYNYFDLPKGYQITQHELPFATTGYLPIIKEDAIQKIPIKILQLEEDTAKSIYSKGGINLDFNRAGNPLIELVTEPVFQDLETVLVFVKQLQNLLRYLEISEARMEKAQLRIDLNFSLQFGNNYSTPRYEIKNLNSLNNLKKAFIYELNKHHDDFFSVGKNPPPSQTLGFDEAKQITIFHREKTNYYYLPEVNIPPIKLKTSEIQQISKKLPKLPWQYWEEMKKIDVKAADLLIKNPFLLKMFSYLEKKNLTGNEKKNWIIFSSNFLIFQFEDDSFEPLIKKWKSYARLFQYWKEKKLDNREINTIVKELRETKKTFTFLIKKYEKKTTINYQLIEQELKSLWTTDLDQKVITDRQRVQNYLLGQIKKKFPDYPIKEVISVILNFLKERTV